MTMLVLDGDAARATCSREPATRDVIVVDLHAARLEELERAARDPRTFYLIGEPAILPLPDGSVDEAVGEGSSRSCAAS